MKYRGSCRAAGYIFILAHSDAAVYVVGNGIHTLHTITRADSPERQAVAPQLSSNAVTVLPFSRLAKPICPALPRSVESMNI